MLPGSLSALTVTLGWAPNTETNLLGYNLYYGLTAGTYPNKVTVGNVTNYAVTGLSNNTPYFFVVRAVNTDDLESDPSNEASFTPANEPPTISAIGNVTVSEDTGTSAIPFTIGDSQTPANSLQLLRASSNTSLVPTNNIVFGGTGNSRTVTVTPAANASGQATITITVSDGVLSTNETFVLTVNGTNDAPVLAAIANQTLLEDTTTNVTVSVSDIDSSGLNLLATSGNPTLIADSQITFSGNGGTRTMQLRPAANQSGVATITVRLDDGSLTNTRNFTLTVTATNDAPTLSAIANQTTSEDTATPVLFCTLFDPDTAAASLSFTASSGNLTLVPNNRITLGGTGTNRTVQVSPANNLVGSAVITLRAGDGIATNTQTFTVTVTNVNDTPTITAIGNQTVAEDTLSSAVGFTIGDTETAPSALNVSARSANNALIPSSAINLTGTGANRSLTFLPATNQSGNTTLTVFVDDGQNTNSLSFTVTVVATNDMPEITAFSDVTLDKNSSTGLIPFTISDVDNPLASLSITTMSTNTTLVPPSSIAIAGSGANWTIRVTPATNQVGMTRIAVRVSDGPTTNRQFLMVTVVDSNTPPVLTVPAQINVTKQTAGNITGSVQDNDSGTAPITVNFRSRYGTVRMLTTVSGGVTAGQVTANNTTNVTVTAPRAAINATFAQTGGVTYTGVRNYVGVDALTVIANDNGNSGPGGPLTDTEVTSVNVTGNKRDHWRTDYFSTEVLLNDAQEATQWGDLADPDGDGCNNLFEYALGLDPLSADQMDNVIAPGVAETGGNRYLTLTFQRRLGDPDLQYLPETSSDQQTWTAGATQVSVTPVNADFERVTYQDATPITPATPRFMRLRIVQNAP